MNSKRLVLSSIVSTLLSIGTVNSALADSPNKTPVKDDASTQTLNDPLPLDDLRLFTLIFDHIRRSYVEPVSDQTLLENAIKGMLQELDPHSDYLNAKNFGSLQETTQGEFSGVGIEIGSDKGYVKIITPIDDTPAAKAGLQSGDIIIELDNQSIRGLSISEAAKRMRGKKGTPITFTIIRQGEDEPIDIVVVRDTIKSRSIRSRIIEDDFGYIRISQFQSGTGIDFVAAIKKLLTENKGLKGFVIDLRNNPGGVLQASVGVVDALINKGTIVSTKGRLEINNQTFIASEGDDTNGLPIVILINGGSASAAEIVAGALQDHQRAIIMGTRSYGKGSVQTVLPVGDDKGIKLTTSRYFTPSGRSIQAEGIVPDVVIERAKITTFGKEYYVKESDLEGHLSKGETDQNNKNKNTDTAQETKKRDTSDNQLFEAINMLKGLAIFNQSASAKP